MNIFTDRQYFFELLKNKVASYACDFDISINI